MFAAFALACSLSAVACASDDSPDNGTIGTLDSGGLDASNVGGHVGNDSGIGDDGAVGLDGGAGIDAGNIGPGATSWIVGNWVYDTDGEYIGSLTVVDNLAESGTVNLAGAQDFGTDITYSSPGKGVVFVGRKDQPSLQRWAVNASGKLALTGELGLGAYGITTTLGRSLPVIQFIAEDKAYFIDIENFQIIVFNPSATPMTIYTDKTFPITGLDVEAVTDGVGTLLRDGDRVLVAGRYWDEDDTATPLVKVAIIDVKTNAVKYAEDKRCANIGSAVVDNEGNTYFGSHPALGVWNTAGLNDAQSPPACIVRIKKGEDAFDASYFVNLQQLSNGGTVGTLMQGVDGHAYVMQYAGADAISAANWKTVMYGASWDVYLLKLADAANTYAKVDGVPKAPGYNSAFTTTVGHEQVTYLIIPVDELAGGTYYDVRNPNAPKKALTFPGYPGNAIPVQ